MTNTAKVKICGINDKSGLSAALEAGADYVGFVFYPPSPRHITLETAKELSKHLSNRAQAIGLFVNPTDQDLENTLNSFSLDMIQLHGDEDETRIREIKLKFQRPVIKAVRVKHELDNEEINELEKAADWLLFDTAGTSADLPGGSGKTFDWNLLREKSFVKPWMLAGGLTSENVGDALSHLKPTAVDVSSGVESSRGVKDPEKIIAFIEAAKAEA